jgi:hypothetical protein
MFGRWRQRSVLNETRRQEFLWAVGGEDLLRETLVPRIGKQIEETYGVQLTEKEVRSLAKLLGGSVVHDWAKAGPETEGRTPEQFVEERIARLVQSLEKLMTGLARSRRRRDKGPASPQS